MTRRMFMQRLVGLCACGPAGEAEDTQDLAAPAAQDHGNLRVAKNGRYFVFDDGTSYVPVGFNQFRLWRFSHSEIDKKLARWAQHGVNYIRVWVDYDTIGLEPKVGQFRASGWQIWTTS